MSATVLERDMLRTRVPERDMSVTTFLHASTFAPRGQPWTAVWCGTPPALVWLHFWRGATTPGGLAEAHDHILAQVQRGEIPDQASGERRAATEEGPRDA